ncbi:hypothetical protein CPB86DRAFT_775143 [Serendipita vermifera]|nr:hypothetical protein CPB86DRAFT_775143 [Serendipita vermifera]
MSACGSCQGQQIVTWSTWRTNCTDSVVSIRSYPRSISTATSVPAWAYLDVVTQDRFNATLAQQAATLPESTAISSQGSTSSTLPSSSDTSTSTPSSPVTSDTPASSKHNNTPAIVGGAVGGIVGLGLIICLIIFLFKRNAKKTKKVAPSAEFTKVMPPGSPMPANFDPAAVGFRSRTASPLSNGLHDSHSGYGMSQTNHTNGSGVIAFQGSPWSPPPVGHTPAPSGGAYSSAYTPPPPGMGRNHLNYTPPPGSIMSSGTPSVHQYSQSYSGSVNYNPTPVYQSMNPYGGTTSGSNPSYTTRNTNVPEI